MRQSVLILAFGLASSSAFIPSTPSFVGRGSAGRVQVVAAAQKEDAFIEPVRNALLGTALAAAALFQPLFVPDGE
jgi:hypothetical protein